MVRSLASNLAGFLEPVTSHGGGKELAMTVGKKTESETEKSHFA